MKTKMELFLYNDCYVRLGEIVYLDRDNINDKFLSICFELIDSELNALRYIESLFYNLEAVRLKIVASDSNCTNSCEFSGIIRELKNITYNLIDTHKYQIIISIYGEMIFDHDEHYVYTNKLSYDGKYFMSKLVRS